MRAIKFRAWDKDANKYVYISETVDGGFWVNNGISQAEMPTNRDSFEQYTGLKDKNGKEIYEGDIFQNDYDGGYDVVKWVERHAGFMLCYMGDEDESESLSLYKMDELEIVGNIHENPELLEEV